MAQTGPKAPIIGLQLVPPPPPSRPATPRPRREPTLPPPPGEAEVPFLINNRYRLGAMIGSGGMGAVYEVFDERRQLTLAMKGLGEIDPEGVNSFKLEFRDFQQLHHPNLCSMDEFFTDGREWFFTMELLRGKDFLAHVRQPLATERSEAATRTDLDVLAREALVENSSTLESLMPPPAHAPYEYPGQLNADALRETLRQLVTGLRHLHLAGRLHRDLKASNVMITSDGRVVVLDFGVGIAFRKRRPSAAGTPLYMAPEMLRRAGSPSADWYAVGVLLYQAMTGRDPFTGEPKDMFEQKNSAPVRPETFLPNIDPNLSRLAMGLMHPSPHSRLGRRAIIEWIENVPVETLGVQSMLPPRDVQRRFVGRRPEIKTLRYYFETLRKRKGTTLVYLEGESGIGKTAMVEEFSSALDRTREALVFTAETLQEEVIPYKSMDGLVDCLAEHLIDLGELAVKKIVNNDFSVVADTFPGIRRVPGITSLPWCRIIDPNERRIRMFSELKKMFALIANSRPLIMVVDDFQWSDADSIVLWNDFVRGDDAPNCLIVAMIRTEKTGSLFPPPPDTGAGAGSSLPPEHSTSSAPPAEHPGVSTGADTIPKPKPPRRGAHQPTPIGNAHGTGIANIAGMGSTEHLSAIDMLPALPEPTYRMFMPRLSDEDSCEYLSARRPDDAPAVIFPPGDVLRQTGGHPLFIDELLTYAGKADAIPSLLQLLAERINKLPKDEQKYLEAVCISAKPLPRNTFGKAVGLTHGEGLRAVKGLKVGHLIRTGKSPGPDGEDWVAPFHYRILNACMGRLSLERKIELHVQVATEMERERMYDAEHLAVQWRDGNEPARAAPYAEKAADAAFEELAFRKAAEFYGVAIKLGTHPPEKRLQLQERLARSFRNSGQGKKGADAFLLLAESTLGNTSFSYRLEAAELLLRNGYVTAGVTELDQILALAGVDRPRSAITASLAMAAGTLRMKVRGFDWTARTETECDVGKLRAIDALWCAASGLGPIEQLSAYACIAEHTYEALRHGDIVRVARAFAAESISEAAQGNIETSASRIDVAKRIQEEVDESRLGIVWAADALRTMMSGDWVGSYALAMNAQVKLANCCVGAFGELAFAKEVEVWGLAASGDFERLVHRHREHLTEAIELGDQYLSVSLRSGLPSFAYLVAGKPKVALREAQRGVRKWSAQGVHLQHVFSAFAEAQAHLYSGNDDDADKVIRHFDELTKSTLVLIPCPLRDLLEDLRGRIALARFLEKKGSLEDILVCVARLKKSEAKFASGLATLIESGIAFAVGDPEAAHYAFQASMTFASAGMQYHYDLTKIWIQRVKGESVRIEERVAVVEPEKLASLLIPGLRTLHG